MSPMILISVLERSRGIRGVITGREGAKCVKKRGQSRTVEAGNTLAILGEEESPQPALELPCCGQKQGVREVEEDDTALI